MSQQEEIDENEEGARSFAHTIATFAEGDLNVDCSKEFCDLLSELHEAAIKYDKPVKGSFKLEFTIEVLESGIVGMVPSIKTKAPEPKRRGANYWVTKGGNLSHENPRQQTLPGLREISGGRKESPREVEVTFTTNAKEI